MDPDTCLSKIRQLAGVVQIDDDPYLAELVEHIEALDEWLSTGGFLPKHWATRWPLQPIGKPASSGGPTNDQGIPM